jgi:YVTN family beta-propeller protein
MTIWNNCERMSVLLKGSFAEFDQEQTVQTNLNQRLLTRVAVACVLFCGVYAIALPVAGQQPYKILDRWKLSDAGWWDYLIADPPAHRLYITRGDHVDVLDTMSGKLVGSIAGLHGTHGVALDNAGKFGYISDGGGNAVVVFDRATLATIATIAAGQNPDGIVFEPATQTVWAFNGRSKDVTVVDAAQRKVVATIPLPGKPEFPAVDGKGLVFDNIEDKSEIVRLDAHTDKLTAEWPRGAERPGI